MRIKIRLKYIRHKAVKTKKTEERRKDMKTKGMILVAVVVAMVFAPVAMAEWGIAPTMSADGRVDGAMASINWSFGGSKSQEILLAKNTPKSRQPRTSAIVKQETAARQFFSAEEMGNLVASIQLPPPVEGRKYLKIGARPVDPKIFDFLKEDAHILLKDVEVKTIDSVGKISVGWLRAGEILVTLERDTRVIRIWKCGNPVLSELYIVAPETIKKVEEPAIALAPATYYEKKPDFFPRETIDKIADKGNDKPTTGWTTGQKWLVGGLAATAVAAVAYAIGQQHGHSKKTTVITTTTTTDGGTGNDPPNGPVPTGPGPEVSN